MGFVDDEQVDGIGENLFVARLDGVALQVLERGEKDDTVAVPAFSVTTRSFRSRMPMRSGTGMTSPVVVS